MDQRPDSLTVDSPASPTPHGSSSTRRQRQSRRREADNAESPQLRLTSLIDVIFLLLVYFVITANFKHDEGKILATLPGNIDGPETVDPPIPVTIELTSADDGVTYHLTVDGAAMQGVSQLHDYLENQVNTGQLAVDDHVQIRPKGNVRWQHVVNVFNACVGARLEQIGFAP